MMNVTSTSMCVRLLFFFGCGHVFRFSDCLTLSAKYGHSKTDVEFKCDIIPYTGSQKWFVDTVQVSVCALIGCSNEPSNPDRYSITSNVSTGIFIFKILSINSTDDKKQVTCYDGTNNQSLYIDMSVEKSESSDSWCKLKEDNDCLGPIIGILLSSITIVSCCFCCCFKYKELLQDCWISCRSIFEKADCKTSDLPDPPKDLKVAENGTTDTSITVQWTEGFDGGCKQEFYVNVNGNEQKVESTCKLGNIWSYTCTGLTTGIWYNIKIKAKNRKGWSASCNAKYRTTGKPDPPKNFRIADDGITDKSIIVEWEPGYDGGYNQTFFVYYNGEEHEVKSLPTNGSPYSFKCAKLKPRSTYEIELYAKNIKGKADPRILKDCETKGRPDPPKDFKLAVDGVKDETMTVEWKEGFNGGYEQTFYVKANNEKEKQVDSECKLKSIWSYTCKGLKPGTVYIIEIKAKNCKGFSEPRRLNIEHQISVY